MLIDAIFVGNAPVQLLLRGIENMQPLSYVLKIEYMYGVLIAASVKCDLETIKVLFFWSEQE